MRILFLSAAAASLSATSPSLANDFKTAQICAAYAIDDDNSHSMVAYEKGILLGEDESGKDDMSIYSVTRTYGNGKWNNVTVSSKGIVQFQSYHQDSYSDLLNKAEAHISSEIKSGQYQTIQVTSSGKQALDAVKQMENRYKDCLKPALMP